MAQHPPSAHSTDSSFFAPTLTTASTDGSRTSLVTDETLGGGSRVSSSADTITTAPSREGPTYIFRPAHVIGPLSRSDEVLTVGEDSTISSGVSPRADLSTIATVPTTPLSTPASLVPEDDTRIARTGSTSSTATTNSTGSDDRSPIRGPHFFSSPSKKRSKLYAGGSSRSLSSQASSSHSMSWSILSPHDISRETTEGTDASSPSTTGAKAPSVLTPSTISTMRPRSGSTASSTGSSTSSNGGGGGVGMTIGRIERSVTEESRGSAYISSGSSSAQGSPVRIPSPSKKRRSQSIESVEGVAVEEEDGRVPAGFADSVACRCTGRRKCGICRGCAGVHCKCISCWCRTCTERERQRVAKEENERKRREYEQECAAEQERLLEEARVRMVTSQFRSPAVDDGVGRTVSEEELLKNADWRSSNPYRRLGLHVGASLGDIKRNYYKLALMYHPDRRPGEEAAEAFVAVRQAYEELGIAHGADP